MSNHSLTTTSRQLCDTTTSSQQLPDPLTTTPETDQPNEEQTTATTSSSTSTSTSRARARACAREAAADSPELPPIERLHQTRDLYEANIGRMNPQVGRAIERFLLAGMQLEVIEEAIGETGWARRPSANYLMAILRRYIDAEIYTLDDLIDDRARHEAEKEARRARRAARWYDEDEPDPIWF